VERNEDRPTVTVAGVGLSTVELVTVVLLAFTGVTHLYAGVVEGAPPVLLAGLGFFGGIGLYLRGYRRRLLTAAAVPFTAVQIPLWYVVKAGNYTTVGYVDKVAQVLLLVCLGLLFVRR
jgi:hypothetical protein